MTNRLFISLDIPKEIIGKVIDLRESIYGKSDEIKWEGEDKFHITLKFLGDVGENLTNLLIDRLENIEFNPIDIEFSSFSFFKRDQKLKILFASFKENLNLNNFQKEIENEFELLGFPKEKRKFIPHLTLLRIKGSEDLNKLEKFYKTNIDIDKFTISNFSLITSNLLESGSEYKIIKSF